ncbi:hypothetical protein SAMN05421837_107379 [Amycolatopsis pretoriensis]|uniref:Minor tail protein n=1 Tax=Amycolatopsis pretoriensis TaxID=218821 RepID=A0A1H5R7R1_9PSEU|nr:hypothetical protein [Amycolatopsis pretoriensis]SEF34416.1 hypothetical protein SAMN05421837_107379 [Amycolatopsis pretoriensis]
MATTLDTYMPYDSGPGSNVTEDGWRQFARHFRGDGVIRNVGSEFRPLGDSTGMQVKVPAGECWIRGQWGSSTATKTLPIAAAHATLQRLDRVILRNDFLNNRIELDVLTGTPGSSSYPSVTQSTAMWEIQLGQVTVPAAAVTITSGNVRAIPEYTDGSCSYTVDAGFQTVASGTTGARIDFDVEQFPSSVVGRPSIREWQLNRAGMWLIVFNLYWDNPNGTGSRRAWIQRQNGGSPNPVKLAWDTRVPVTDIGPAHNISALERFSSGEIVEMWGAQNSGVSINVLGTSTFNEGTRVQLYWLGP